MNEDEKRYIAKIEELEEKNKFLSNKLKFHEKMMEDFIHPRAKNIPNEIITAENMIPRKNQEYDERILMEYIEQNEKMFPSRDRQVKNKMREIIRSYTNDSVKYKCFEDVIAKYLLGYIK